MKFLSTLTLRMQLAILTGAFSIIIVFLGYNSIDNNNEALAHSELVYYGMSRPTNFAGNVIDHALRVRAYVTEAAGFHHTYEQAKIKSFENLKAMNEQWQQYIEALKVFGDPEEIALKDRADKVRTQYEQAVHKFYQIPLEDTDTLNRAGLEVVRINIELTDTLIDIKEYLVKSTEQQFIEQQNEGIQENSASVVLIVSSILIGGLISLLISKNIQKNIGEAVHIAGAIANKELNRDIPKTPARTEIGQLLDSFGIMQNSIRGVIQSIAQGSEDLTNSAVQLSNVSNQVRHGSRQQSEAASTAAAAIEELTVSIDQVNARASNTRQAAEQAREDSTRSSTVIRQASEQVQSIAQTMQHSVRLAEDLGARSQEINAIVNTIRDIADQTNLLALNAAIEAARAGEQGRGFAVVADEVRKLAERTSSSTEEIGTVVDNIRNGIQTMVDNMKSSEGQVSDGVAMAEQAKHAIDTITQGSDNILFLVSSIADALNEQNIASQQIARSVEHIAQMAEENDNAIMHVTDASSHLDQLANSLYRNVAQFQL